MQTAKRIRGRTQATIVVSLMFGLWLQILGLTTSPHFHEWLHADSSTPDHECPITLFGKGSLLLEASSQVAVAAPVADAFSGLAEGSFFLPTAEYRLNHSRGPPSC